PRRRALMDHRRIEPSSERVEGVLGVAGVEHASGKPVELGAIPNRTERDPGLAHGKAWPAERSRIVYRRVTREVANGIPLYGGNPPDTMEEEQVQSTAHGELTPVVRHRPRSLERGVRRVSCW